MSIGIICMKGKLQVLPKISYCAQLQRFNVSTSVEIIATHDCGSVLLSDLHRRVCGCLVSYYTSVLDCL